MGSGWRILEVPLRFQVSDITLFAPRLRVQSRELALLEMPPVAGPIPPDDSLPPGSVGFLIHSLPVLGAPAPLRRTGDYLCYVLAHYWRYYIDLSQSFADYRAGFSGRTRSTIERKVRRYKDRCGGKIVWQGYRTAGEMEAFYRLARAVSVRSYQEKWLGVGLPSTEKFQRDMLELAEAGRVRGYILFCGERPVSYLYCPATNGIVRYSYLGYDPDFGQLSVGSVLQWLALEALFAEGCFRLFDFTEGASEHKRLFSTHNVQCVNVFFLRRSLSNLALVQGHRWFNRSSAAVGNWLDAVGCKRRIKRFIRFGWSRGGDAGDWSG